MKTFNSNFYIAAATVIPVLYVALALQGSFVFSLITRIEEAAHKLHAVQANTPKEALAIFFAVLIGSPLYYITLVILLVSGAGEILAIVMLIQQSDNIFIRWLVASAVILLVVVALIAPLWTLYAARRRFRRAYGELKSEIFANPEQYSVKIVSWLYEWFEWLATRR